MSKKLTAIHAIHIVTGNHCVKVIEGNPFDIINNYGSYGALYFRKPVDYAVLNKKQRQAYMALLNTGGIPKRAGVKQVEFFNTVFGTKFNINTRLKRNEH